VTAGTRSSSAREFGYDYNSPDQKERRAPQDFRQSLSIRREQSLQHLGTDYIGFYQMHNQRLPQSWTTISSRLEDLKAEGKIRHYAAALSANGWERGLR
jgi:aryl-alcohol dehydrogenase-like predicted oxidoreductase